MLAPSLPHQTRPFPPQTGSPAPPPALKASSPSSHVPGLATTCKSCVPPPHPKPEGSVSGVSRPPRRSPSSGLCHPCLSNSSRPPDASSPAGTPCKSRALLQPTLNPPLPQRPWSGPASSPAEFPQVSWLCPLPPSLAPVHLEILARTSPPPGSSPCPSPLHTGLSIWAPICLATPRAAPACTSLHHAARSMLAEATSILLSTSQHFRGQWESW